MGVLKIITAPDDILNQQSLPIEKIDDKIKQIAQDMLQTMYSSGGIGLSAVQVGILIRLIVVDVDHKIVDGVAVNKNNYVMINPEIVSKSNEIEPFEEGCLSFPSEYIKVKRPKVIEVKYTTLDGEQKTITADGLFGICIQHEIDHLNGVTIVKYASRFKEEMVMKRLKKLKDSKNAKG